MATHCARAFFTVPAKELSTHRSGHSGQGSISLEYQTYTSPHPFDTLVTRNSSRMANGANKSVHKKCSCTKIERKKVAGRQGFEQSTQLSCVLPQILDRPPVKNGHKSNISYFCPHSIFVPSIFKSHLHILKSTTTEDSLNLNKDSLANLLALPNCDCPNTF